jgi:integrase
MKDGGCRDSYNNLVFGAASRVLRFAKVWKRLESEVKRIRERAKPAGRVLTQQEESRLFQVASSKPGWVVAYAAGLIAASTTCRGCELKALKWKDVDLFSETASIPDSKTDEGVRLVALNPDAVAGFLILLDRARLVNGDGQDHYVFPACEHGHIDPTRPQKTWRTAWRSLTTKAGLPGLRFHDCRYLAVTKMGEVGVPDQVIMAQAGHVSKRMLDYYSKARLKAKREAVNAMAPILPRQAEVPTLRPM